jgi:hypothetical protein
MTLSMAAAPAPAGNNAVVVTIHDPAGRVVVGAEASIALLAYIWAISANPNSASAPNQYIHTPGASATEGQGLIPVPARLEASAEAGAYRGVVSFAKEGTWTTVVAFTIQGQARAVLFTIGIVDQRPRLALMGGFATVNVGIIIAAAVRKRTTRPQGNQRARMPSGSTAQPTQQASAPHLVDLSQQDHHGATSGRSLVVAHLGETVPGISGETGPLMTTLVRGQYPDGATHATVRTDENCAADGEGVSHCLNELDLSGTTIVVQHHHKMSLTPCLTPGETVNVMTAAEYQAQS